ncbi:hypothetical protein SLEP1_g59153 [Rubroshorea leprosula]|uniref:Uncharacterized protein n=1 Tax=Rubroshorea leprosula TaxID=152421 RepID=A0AAV5MRI6_9ROSI|nr:hypothetical protein SLEP1_g59153 [Rubroshorea leprosula]
MEKLCVDWGLKQDPLSYAFKTLGKGDPGLGFGHRVFPPRVVSKSLALDSDFFDVFPLILSLSKSMVELEPGKVLHDRRERLFGPLVVVTPSQDQDSLKPTGCPFILPVSDFFFQIVKASEGLVNRRYNFLFPEVSGSEKASVNQRLEGGDPGLTNEALGKIARKTERRSHSYCRPYPSLNGIPRCSCKAEYSSSAWHSVLNQSMSVMKQAGSVSMSA